MNTAKNTIVEAAVKAVEMINIAVEIVAEIVIEAVAAESMMTDTTTDTTTNTAAEIVVKAVAEESMMTDMMTSMMKNPAAEAVVVEESMMINIVAEIVVGALVARKDMTIDPKIKHIDLFPQSHMFRIQDVQKGNRTKKGISPYVPCYHRKEENKIIILWDKKRCTKNG